MLICTIFITNKEREKNPLQIINIRWKNRKKLWARTVFILCVCNTEKSGAWISNWCL